MDIPNLGIDGWLGELKPYQRNAMHTLLSASADEEEAARQWLTSNGPDSVAKFGGAAPDRSPFWDKFKDEFRAFVCGDEKYSDLRAKLDGQKPIAGTVLLTSISGAIGATLGFVPALLVPAVAIMLNIAGTMGLNAFCAMA